MKINISRIPHSIFPLNCRFGGEQKQLWCQALVRALWRLWWIPNDARVRWGPCLIATNHNVVSTVYRGQSELASQTQKGKLGDHVGVVESTPALSIISPTSPTRASGLWIQLFLSSGKLVPTPLNRGGHGGTGITTRTLSSPLPPFIMQKKRHCWWCLWSCRCDCFFHGGNHRRWCLLR